MSKKQKKAPSRSTATDATIRFGEHAVPLTKLAPPRPGGARSEAEEDAPQAVEMTRAEVAKLSGAKWNPLRRAWCRTVHGRLVPLDPQPPPPSGVSHAEQPRIAAPAPKIIA